MYRPLGISVVIRYIMTVWCPCISLRVSSDILFYRFFSRRWECGSPCKMSQGIKHELMDQKWKGRYDAIPRMYFGWIGNFSWQPFILQYDLWTQPICSVICDFDVAPIVQRASTACPIWANPTYIGWRSYRSGSHVFRTPPIHGHDRISSDSGQIHLYTYGVPRFRTAKMMSNILFMVAIRAFFLPVESTWES